VDVQATRIEKLLKTPLVFFKTAGFKKKFWLIGVFVLLIIIIVLGFGIKTRQAFLANQKKKTFSEGMKYFQKGNFNKAIPELKKATELDPKNAKVHLNLAQSYEATNKLNKAIKSYQTSLNINPNQPEILYNLAIIYKSQGKIKESIKKLEEAIKLRKDFVAARLVLAELYIQQKQKQKAIEQYQTVINMKPFGTDLAEIEKKMEGVSNGLAI
jgi:Tfp pilus assembly protein PilF